ncbi:MAG: class I SAM-dependent methyltransferase [Dehalococcoidia bacterium]
MTQAPAPEEVQQQAGKILAHVAGYVGARTIVIGLRFGLFETLAEGPMTSDQLAENRGIDKVYSMVWCRSAFAAEVLEKEADGRYKLAPHMDKLLLTPDFPGYVGAVPMTLSQPEMFDSFADKLESGKRLWWNECGPEFVKSVSGTGRPFYTRMIPGGLSKIPGLAERLEAGAHVLDLACGAGFGLVKFAAAYPKITLAGLDGDQYSLGLVQELLANEGIADRASLVHSTLEEFDQDGQYDLAFINISMHECRDLDKVAQNVHRALKPDGLFVISDMPFPESDEDCRTVPARVMSGIQFFEAQIDDQLLPTQAYVDLLNRHGYRNVASFDMTPFHVVIHGQK